ncbi:MAG TPA: class I tRNA ligase family protein, partial [Solirubrobacteraceae bacterium]|nr:class I tRNA ligase family protein [Solirubrobacteraceae bacterium]
AQFHVIGKDILKFHAIYWPALLMAAGLAVPEHVLVHGFLLMDDQKMSKSLGNVLDPFEAMDKFGADALRYYLLRDVSFGGDGNVSPASFEARYESELANEYGNLASRTIAMVGRYRDGAVRAVDLDPELAQAFDGLADEFADLLDRAELTQALDVVWHRVRRLNRYVEERAPWQLARDPAAADALDQALASLVEGLRVVSVLLHAYMPASVEKLLGALGAPDLSFSGATFAAHGPGGHVTTLEPLFPKSA